MKKNHTLLGMLFVLAFVGFSTLKINAQVGEIILWNKQDTYVSGDVSESALPHGGEDKWNIVVTGDRGPNHGWIQWDLQWLLDSIPEGEEILYAEMVINITNTSDPKNGFWAILLDNDVFDYWDQETFTWLMSEDMTGKSPYDSIYHDTLYFEEDTPSKSSGPRTFEVTDVVKNHMNGEGNKLITVRLNPFNTTNSNGYWLGFYAREARWDPTLQNPFVEEEDIISKYTSRIKVYYGKSEKIFSDVNYFGDKSNYLAFPKNPVEFWNVDDVDGVNNNRIVVQGKTGVFPKVSAATDGLTAMLVYDKKEYETFHVAFDARLSKADFYNPIIVDPEDIAFIFDWVDENTYSCFLFHQIDTIGRFFKVENGKRTLTDDVDFDFENSVAYPKYDDYHKYEIIKTDNSITVYVDGIEIGSTNNAEFLSGSGKIGVGTLNNQVYFDNFEELSADITPPATPTGLIIDVLTSTSVTFSWDIVGEEKLTYNVYKDSTFIASVNNNSLTFEGLTPNITCHFMVSAIDSVGNESDLSDTLKVLTKLSVPTGLKVDALTSASVSFGWDAPENEKLIYNVYNDSVFIVSTNDTMVNVKGLTPNTTYHFMVSAIDSSGNESELSDTLKVLTKLSAPNGLKVDALTSASVSFSWDALVNGEMLYRIYKNGVYTMSTVDESITVSNLDPNTMYAFTVVAIDSAGNNSEYSEPLQVSTIKSGIREYNTSGIEIYPNPLTFGELTVDLRKVNDANISIVITSITGELIYHESVNSNVVIIPTEKLINGVYIVTVKSQASVLEQHKVVVVR